MAKHRRARSEPSRLFWSMTVLPLGAIVATLLDWTWVAGVLAAAWLVGVVFSVWIGWAVDRKYGTWGSDHTLGP